MIPTSQSGFTMIELMIVLVIIGIMIAVIVPEMSGTYEGALLRSNTRKLVAVLSLAASHSVAINQEHRVHIDPKNGRFHVEKLGRSSDDGGITAARDVPGGEGELDPRIAIEISDSAPDPLGERTGDGEPAEEEQPHEGIIFRPDGTAEAKDIVLRDRAGFRLALRINPATARVQIMELERQ